MAMNTLLFIALQSYILGNLLKPEMTGAVAPHLTRKSFVGVVLLARGRPRSVDVRVAFVLYALTPLFFVTPPQPQC
jgi:hypothetical protein